MRKTGFLVLFLCVSQMAFPHPLHLSFTNLEYNAEHKKWEAVVKIFWDDLEDHVKQQSGLDLGFRSGKHHPEAGAILRKWLADRLVVTFNNKVIPLSQWQDEGWEMKEDAVWLRFSFVYDKAVREVKLRNTILFDYFTDQKNLVIFTIGDWQKGYEFKHGKPETVFKVKL